MQQLDVVDIAYICSTSISHYHIVFNSENLFGGRVTFVRSSGYYAIFCKAPVINDVGYYLLWDC